ncbi:MAG: hypothetical protein ACM4D3_23215, partial [Candidatus Sericytochromatia bacterium]
MADDKGTPPGAQAPEDATIITAEHHQGGYASARSANGGGEGVLRDDIRLYLDAVFGGDTGIAVFALGMKPYKDPETGKYKHGYWSETSGEKITFDWPGA